MDEFNQQAMPEEFGEVTEEMPGMSSEAAPEMETPETEMPTTEQFEQPTESMEPTEAQTQGSSIIEKIRNFFGL